jgi:predicted permease
MELKERHKIFRQLMWDYNISPLELDAVMTGKAEWAGHYNKQAIIVKLLESCPWFTIVQLFTQPELYSLLTNEIIEKLHFISLRTKYSYVQKRLQQLVPVAG